MIRGGTSSTARVAALLFVALALLATACGSDSSGSGSGTSGSGSPGSTAPAGGTGGSTPPGTEVAADAAFAGPGPYIAGTTRLDMGGRTVEVWYPAEPSSAAGASKRIFEIRDLLPEQLKAIVPDEVNPKYETNAYVDIPASGDGPFPLVLFAHGFGAYPTEYQTILTHLASWGFVVAGPDFDERGLLAAFSSGGGAATTTTLDPAAAQEAAQARIDSEAAIMSQARELMAAEDAKPGGLLEGAVDATNVGTAGHSAGVTSAVAAAATDPNVKTFVAMSGGRAPGATITLPTPDVPGMVMTGGKDQIASIDNVKGFYDSLNAPKRLVVIDDAGHNSFNDLCVIGADQGGLLAIATKVGIPTPENLQRLFLDGCESNVIPAPEAWVPIGHFLVAQFRFELGVDDEPVGLEPGVDTAFLPTAITFQVAEQ
jgi:predicted dienelactone hydrolase